ncbi:hypothetical protein QQS21_012533 [Conoideocrella luteorostrata]|uniref:Peptidase M43 pregnancy-associated plasma-A domain-containing protein n=1 Tax=Conoideocrella luteorostrata TaxID=1105319 RepID=A0AAJ0CDV1_9HYPO|nr:hypothetical protein QQS21_012533 [Conoideocrella luteorostrata]
MLPGALAIWLGVATHASFVAFAAAASAPGCQTAQQRVHRCGTAKPSKVLMEAHKELAKNKDHKTHSIDRNEVMNNIGLFAHAAPSKGVVKSKEHETRDIAPDEVINIDLYAHVVMSDEKNQSLASDTMVNKQLEMLNEAYKKSNFHFNLKKIVRVNNAAWALGQDGSEMRRQLRQGDQKTVNVFFLEKLQGGAIGLAQLPDRWARLGLDSDYVNIQVNTITGSSSKSNSQGITLVHEIGHWLGLLHPDEYGCDMGDFIDDTPAMAYIYHNCTAADSCPGEKYPGEDPIHNYMSDGPE